MGLKLAITGLLIAGAVASRPQPATVAVFDLRACFDKSNVARIKEIDKELQAMADRMAERLREAPDEKEKLKAQYIEFYERRKLEIYQVVDRVVAEIGKDKGYTIILRRDPMPTPSDGQNTLNHQIDRRVLFYQDPQVDITAEVLKRLNEALSKEPPKKDF